MDLFLWYFISIFVHQSSSYILRTRCTSHGNFSVMMENSGLHMNDVISIKQDIDADMCKFECIMTNGCKSFTYNEDYLKCQLYKKSDQDPLDNSTLTHMNGWTYRTTSYSIPEVGLNCEKKKPCRKGQLCMDICECPGYHCSDINECASQPCQNRGRCINGDNYFNCECVPGFTGIVCETNINECASSPCKNGGICHDALNGYSCACQTGYMGIHCELITACAEHRILSSATRAVSFYDGTLGCDNELETGWYRFVSPAGTEMLSHVPEGFGLAKKFHCQTHAGGYLASSHPAIDDGVVTSRVCFSWKGNPCWHNKNIQVFNCSQFYIYYLYPTAVCELRYCGNL